MLRIGIGLEHPEKMLLILKVKSLLKASWALGFMLSVPKEKLVLVVSEGIMGLRSGLRRQVKLETLPGK